MNHTQALHSSYLTPKQLAMSPKLHKALMWFVDEHDAGNIVELPDRFRLLGIHFFDGKPEFFKMDYVNVIFDCGTAGCILGYIRHRIDEDRPRPAAVQALFYVYPRRHVTSAEARDATVRVLRGEPAWPSS